MTICVVDKLDKHPGVAGGFTNLKYFDIVKRIHYTTNTNQESKTIDVVEQRRLGYLKSSKFKVGKLKETKDKRFKFNLFLEIETFYSLEHDAESV